MSDRCGTPSPPVVLRWQRRVDFGVCARVCMGKLIEERKVKGNQIHPIRLKCSSYRLALSNSVGTCTGPVPSNHPPPYLQERHHLRRQRGEDLAALHRHARVRLAPLPPRLEERRCVWKGAGGLRDWFDWGWSSPPPLYCTHPSQAHHAAHTSTHATCHLTTYTHAPRSRSSSQAHAVVVRASPTLSATTRRRCWCCPSRGSRTMAAAAGGGIGYRIA